MGILMKLKPQWGRGLSQIETLMSIVMKLNPQGGL